MIPGLKICPVVFSANGPILEVPNKPSTGGHSTVSREGKYKFRGVACKEPGDVHRAPQA